MIGPYDDVRRTALNPIPQPRRTIQSTNKRTRSDGRDVSAGGCINDASPPRTIVAHVSKCRGAMYGGTLPATLQPMAWPRHGSQIPRMALSVLLGGAEVETPVLMMSTTVPTR